MNSLVLSGCVFEGNVSDEGAQGGGCIGVDHCDNLQVTGCSFIENHAIDNFSDGGALCLFINGGFSDCNFEGNTGLTDPFGGGGAVCAKWGGISFERCTFKGNTVDDEGGALNLYSLMDGAEIRECTFWENVAGEYGGAIAVRAETPVVITGCTMYDNSAPTAACVLCAQGSSIDMANSILAFGTVGDAVHSVATGTSVTLSCCDVYGNEGGDWVDCIYGQDAINGNLSADPIFCAPAWEDFSIADGSPCAPFTPPNTECDLIGAWPVGCATASIPDDLPPDGTSLPITWGALKTGFRH